MSRARCSHSGLLFPRLRWFTGNALLLSALLLFAGVVYAKPNPPVLCTDGSTDCGNTSVVPQGEKKWNPGHYMQFTRGAIYSYTQENRFAAYDEIGNETAIQGVSYFVRWSQLEGQRGDYSAGIAMIRREIEYLKNLPVPKRLILRFADSDYGATCPTDELPRYVQDNGWVFQANSGCVLKRWNSDLMDAYIALIQAYAAAFDNEPYFEGLHLLTETAGSWGGSTPPADYSNAAFERQINRLVFAAGQAFSKSNVVLPVNWYTSDAATVNLFEHMRDNLVGTGGPDTCPTCEIQGDRVLTGAIGGVDFRGRMPVIYSVEVSELGLNTVGRKGGYLPAELFDYQNNVLRATHVLWDRNEFAGTAEQQWSTGILPFIINNPRLTYDFYPY